MARFSRLTLLPGRAFGTVWTPDGKYVAFGNMTTRRVYLVRADGGSDPAPISDEFQGTAPVPQSFSPNAATLIFNFGTSGGLHAAPVDWSGAVPKLGKIERLAVSVNASASARLSPDGKWLAYSAPEGFRNEVYVRPFPNGAGKWQISLDGGVRPEWSLKSNELFFLDIQGRVHSVTYTASGSTFQAGQPRQWTPRRTWNRDYSVAPDGKRLVASLPGGGQADQKLDHLTFLVNFFDEVRRRLRTPDPQ